MFRHFDDWLHTDSEYIEQEADNIYPIGHQLINNNTSDNEVAFLKLNLSTSGDVIVSTVYEKQNDFDFDIVNVPCFCIALSTPYGVYISQLICSISLCQWWQ